MDVSHAAPRVNAAQLAGLVGKKVLLVGRIQNVVNDVATVTAADGGSVAVKLDAARGYALDAPVAEFEAIVRGPAEVEEAGGRAMFSQNFDMDAYNQLVTKANTTYKPIFAA